MLETFGRPYIKDMEHEVTPLPRVTMTEVHHTSVLDLIELSPLQDILRVSIPCRDRAETFLSGSRKSAI